jgi:predicted metal-binding membrane protein
MLMMVALGVMSPAWMAATAVLVLMQKLLPIKAAVDVPVALAIVALGIAIIVSPSWIPGIVPQMQPMQPMHHMPSL